MKNIFILLLALIALSSCEKETAKSIDYTNFKAILNPKGTTLKALSNDDVVKEAWIVQFGKRFEVAVEKNEERTKVIIPSWYIIDRDRLYDLTAEDCFLTAQDVVIMKQGHEVIAYVPNATMRKAQTLITNAFNADKMDSCMYYLQTMYVFTPIDNEEFWNLERQDLN